MDVPNLDAMSAEELYFFANQCADKIPSALEGSRQLEVSALYVLADYAQLKAKATTRRHIGNVEVAMILEKACDQLYKLLPPEARW